MRNASKRRLSYLALFVVPAMTVVACSTPTGSSSNGGNATKQTGGLAGIYAQLKGLSGAQRTSKLVKLAKEEDSSGNFTVFYTANTTPADIQSFEKKYGLKVQSTTGSPNDILARLQQEAKANDTSGVDVVMNNDIQMTAANGLFTPIQSPELATIDPKYINKVDNWAPTEVDDYVVAWNTNSFSNHPTTWKQILGQHPSGLALEITDWPWFATLVQGYLMPKLGLTKTQAIDEFKTLAQGATAVSGHTLISQLTAAGQFKYTPDVYQAEIAELPKTAPVKFQPVVEPIIARRDGIGIVKWATQPATSLLFSEYILSPAVQKTELADQGSIPILTSLQSSTFSSLDVVTEDTTRLLKEESFWEAAYNSVLKEVKGPTRSS